MCSTCRWEYSSERRDSNPRQPRWQRGALPTELLSQYFAPLSKRRPDLSLEPATATLATWGSTPDSSGSYSRNTLPFEQETPRFIVGTRDSHPHLPGATWGSTPDSSGSYSRNTLPLERETPRFIGGTRDSHPHLPGATWGPISDVDTSEVCSSHILYFNEQNRWEIYNIGKAGSKRFGKPLPYFHFPFPHDKCHSRIDYIFDYSTHSHLR